MKFVESTELSDYTIFDRVTNVAGVRMEYKEAPPNFKINPQVQNTVLL